MHRAGLDALGLDGSYEAIEVDAVGMVTQALRVRSGDLLGANITMPHKQLAADLCDVLSGPAARARSVNTWYLNEDDLVGESTDIPGVLVAMERRGLDAHRILLLGTGGAAAAALVALQDREVYVSGRSMDRALGLVDQVEVQATVVPWEQPVPGATVVNATPIGMDGSLLPLSVIEVAEGLFDMVYQDSPTASVMLARQFGFPIADGIDLLVAQAELSFEIWIGTPPAQGLFDRVARNDSSKAQDPPIL